ncbi:Rid family hydrolase [Bradyrhizobium sp. BWA-3-5]|uniref:Rid family hydrolase n=1 Tax=Bradyrhizobium sp. BWA-3-5 TaxID=3080013 RepID=UPI00293EC89A|nr:Rid family hydrolase [Bradyrhizobium sp. BWA-3-5]WOH65799.1 Rid family hydrolase [Bradyrhizobium sp. BWA-3-5]
MPIAADGARLADKDFQTQARQALANLEAALAAANSAADRLIHVRVYVTDIDDWPAFDKLYSEWIAGPRGRSGSCAALRLSYRDRSSGGHDLTA